MFKRIVGITMLFALTALLFNIGPGVARSTQALQISTQARGQASKLLKSTKAKYLSSAGRNALNLVANPQEQEVDRQSMAAVRSGTADEVPLIQLSPHEALVNDPAKDAFDATSQNSTAVASFNDTVLVAYNDTGQLFETNSMMGYSRSTDGGRTFIDMDTMPVPSPPLGQNIGGPGLAADRAGNFYVTFMGFDPSGARPEGFEVAIGVAKSTDGGATFQSPVLLPPVDANQFSFEDRGSIAVDNSGNPMTGSNVYVSFTHISSNFDEGVPTAFSRSTDGGASFSAPILLSDVLDVTQGAETVVGKNGEVYVTWFKSFSLAPAASEVEPKKIFIAKSINGGQSFGVPTLVANLQEIGASKTDTLSGGIRVRSFPRLAVSPVDGTLYIVYAANPPGPDGADVFLTRSTDGGATWSVPEKVNDGSGSMEFFPDVAVNRNGVVQVIWYSERLLTLQGFTPEQISVRQKQSIDGRRSFGREQRVTPFSFTPAIGYDPFLDPLYIGDNLDLVAGFTADGPSFNFLMAWTDFRRIMNSGAGNRHDQDVIFSVNR